MDRLQELADQIAAHGVEVLAADDLPPLTEVQVRVRVFADNGTFDEWQSWGEVRDALFKRSIRRALAPHRGLSLSTSMVPLPLEKQEGRR